MRLKVVEASWHAFSSKLLSRTDVESAGILLARVLDCEGDKLLIVEELSVVPDEGYLIRQFDRLRLDPVVLNRMTQRARDEGLSIFTVHTHPMASDAWFSWADDTGDSRLMPSLHAQASGVPHGSIVIAATGATLVRAFDENAKATNIDFDVVGRQLLRHPAAPSSRTRDERFARQELALGDEGQRRLQELRVGVLGLGGVGSVVAMQLVHLGVRDLVFVDGDVVSETNLSRLVGASRRDVGVTSKVEVARRYATSTDMPCEVHIAAEYFGDQHLALARSCDVLFSCVDRHTPRALVNRLAYDALIPVIDMGTAFRVDSATGVMTGSAGRVVVVGPGRPCLNCWGHINPDALREEALAPADREVLAQQGYIRGAAVAQPSVMPFNTNVAGAAVIEFVRMATGFAGAENPPDRLAFRFDDGEVGRNVVERRAGCMCGRT